MNKVSPFAGSVGYFDPDGGALYLGERIRYKYRELPDNRIEYSATGETLRTVAQKYLPGLANLPAVSASDFFWVIGDFQRDWAEWQEDLTIRIPINTRIDIPSEKTVNELIIPRLARPVLGLDDE